MGVSGRGVCPGVFQTGGGYPSRGEVYPALPLYSYLSLLVVLWLPQTLSTIEVHSLSWDITESLPQVTSKARPPGLPSCGLAACRLLTCSP